MSSRVLQGLAWLVRQTFRTMSNSGSQTISLTTSTIGEEVRTTSPPAPRQSGGSSDKPSTKGVDLTLLWQKCEMGSFDASPAMRAMARRGAR